MTRRVYDKFTKVTFVAAIADITAPTAAECNGGTELTSWIPKDGVRPSGSQNTVDQGDISTQFEAKTIGTYGEDFELMFFRGTPGTDDDAWDLAVVNTTGFLVIRRMEDASTAFAAADAVEVREIQMGQKQMANSAANENQKFSLKYAIAAIELDAVVAA